MHYTITHNFDNFIENIHHIVVSYNGESFNIIFGRCSNGGFFSIPDWGVGGELSYFNDKFWNEESIGRVIKNKKTAKAIAMAIAEFGEGDNG